MKIEVDKFIKCISCKSFIFEKKEIERGQCNKCYEKGQRMGKKNKGYWQRSF